MSSFAYKWALTRICAIRINYLNACHNYSLSIFITRHFLCAVVTHKHTNSRKLDKHKCKTFLRSFGAVMRGPRVLGPHEAVTAAHILVPQALLTAMRPPGTALRLELAVELEFEQRNIA